MSCSIRFGQIEDVDLITKYILHAGGGFFEFLLDGIIPGVQAKHLVRVAVSETDSALSHQNAVLAFQEEVCVGIALSYSSDQFGFPSALKSLVPKKRLSVLAPILEEPITPSLYINTLVVDDSVRGQGIGRALVEFSAGLAQELDYSDLTLHVWADNERALNLYQSVGFQLVSRKMVPRREKLDHPDGMLLMRARLPLLH